MGEEGLAPNDPGRPVETVSDALRARLLALVIREPKEFGYARARWTSEMLALQLKEELDVKIHSSTVRRVLPKIGVKWNRARPTLMIKDPQKDRKMKAIKEVLAKCDADNPVFYVDEVDIDLNPKIGHCWSQRGHQQAIPTPGKNEKRYLCGAVHANTRKVVWSEWKKKNTDIFLLLMAALRKRYRKAKRIYLILDNYRIHKSYKVKMFLSHNPKFRLLFQPVYHPWVNKIEGLWKKLNDTVTRNHRFSTMKQLMNAVYKFMERASTLFSTELACAKN